MAFGSGPPGRVQIDFGLSGPIPRDILVLMGLTFFSFTLGAFRSTEVLVYLAQMTPRIWSDGFLWQLVTYPFATPYRVGALALIFGLWMTLMFGKQVFFYVGRKAFWRYFFTSALIGGMAAALVQVLLVFSGLATTETPPFAMMNGIFFILAFVTTGFAVLYGHATIYMMFVLPVKASWFIGIEIAFAFLAFLSTHDFAGFIGICAIVGASYVQFSGRGPGRLFHEARLRLERRWLEYKLRRLNKRGGDPGGVVKGPWIN